MTGCATAPPTPTRSLGPIVRRAADAIADAARLRDLAEQPARPSGADSTAFGRVQPLLEVLDAEPPVRGEDHKERVAEALRAAGGHHVVHFGRFTTEKRWI